MLNTASDGKVTNRGELPVEAAVGEFTTDSAQIPNLEALIRLQGNEFGGVRAEA